MNPLQNEVTKHINKLVRPLKEEDELKMALKAKLTKKEFKLLDCLANDGDIDELKSRLNLDEERYKELYEKLVKKLNQEKIKQQICD